MANISELGNLNPTEPLDLDSYIDNKEFTGIPAKGRYTVRAPESFPQEAFSLTQEGNLSISLDPTIVGPTNEGYTLRFTKVSAKQFKRQGVTASQVGDYLRACGVRGKFNTPQEQVDAVEQTVNQVYQVDVDWRAYNKNTKYQLKGMEHFTKDGNGSYLPFCEDPGDFEKDEAGEVVKDAEGNPAHKKLRANAYVERYVPAQ